MSSKKIKKKKLISVIIPAFNEGKTIGKVIDDVRTVSNVYALEIIVVNDGSTDTTLESAEKYGATKIISHKKNLGKGAAFKTGLLNAKGVYIVQIDADNQLKAKEIPKLIEPLEKGYDMVLGSRYDLFSLLSSDFTSFIKMSGNFFLSFSTSIFSGRKIIDVMTGFKAMKRSVGLSINPQVTHFGYEAELVVKAAKKKYKIKNVVVFCKRRETGRSNLKIIKHGLLVFKTIIESSFS